MLALLDPEDLDRIEDASIAELVRRRQTEAREAGCEPEEAPAFYLVEAGDAVEAVESGAGVWITRNPFDQRRFGEAGFSPTFELLLEHPGCPGCFEVLFLGGGDFGVTLVVPKHPGIDAALTAFCQRFASLASDLEAD